MKKPWIVVAFFAVGGIGVLFEHPDDTAAIPREVVKPAEKASCGDVRIRKHLDLVVCDESGGSSPIQVRDESGAALGTVTAGARVYRIDREGIRREPGHVDEQVCFASGEREGTLAWVQTTHFMVGPCSP